MEQTFYIPDIECDSCSRVLTKLFNSQEGIKHFRIADDAAWIDYDKNKIDENGIIGLIKAKGFRASTTPFARKTFFERYRHFKENPAQYVVESRIISYFFSILFTLIGIEALAYIFVLDTIPGFLANYGWWLLYLNISLAAITAAIWHVTAYLKNHITCMTGMMIGMTIGMQTGMLIGAVVGATNGFFMGSMVGMLLGCAVGWLTGRCCGVMGTMEGLMAGVMGGTMGPMISVMMFSDNLLIFMPFYVAINVIILGGLSVMMYEEVAEGKQHVKTPIEFAKVISVAVITCCILLAIMIYGPKSALVAF